MVATAVSLVSANFGLDGRKMAEIWGMEKCNTKETVVIKIVYI